jgi:hypothetical protein
VNAIRNIIENDYTINSKKKDATHMSRWYEQY